MNHPTKSLAALPSPRGPRRSMSNTPRNAKRLLIPLAAAAIAGAMLPISSATPALAEDDGAPAFSGFSMSAWSTPVRLEIYEPTIPIPATPQAEFEFGYTRVEADSSSSRGRASFLWPGDSLGEGLKTVVENLGLPPELSGPIAAQGYPVQVNSTYPSETTTEANQPFPGTVMNTTASEDKTVASVGYSSNCDVADAGGSDGGSGGGGTPGIPGLPELPIPGLPGLSTGSGNLLDQLGNLLSAPKASSGKTGKAGHSRHAGHAKASTTAAADGEDAAACQIPAQLSALIDFGGYVSTSRSVSSDTEVVASSRAALGDVSLLGGIVTMSGINARAVSSSDGKKTHGDGRAAYGTLSIAGQEFGIGPEGFIAAGSPAPIPGLPDDPAKALQKLGITITIPKPVYTKDGDKLTTVVEGLVVDLDTGVLHHYLDALPWSQFTDLVNQIPFPPEAGPIKSALLSIPTLAPRFVIHLGTATSIVETVQGIDIPPIVPDNDPGGDDPGDGGNSSTSSGGTAPSSGEPPSSTTPTGDDTSADGDLTDAGPVGAGLPPLFSIPGVLLFGGIAAAAVVGSYFRKLGLAALGGGAPCPHGLDSGLPDLRKA